MSDRTIWKYPLNLYDEAGMITTRPVLSMPRGAQILTLQMQDLKPTVWAVVNPDAVEEQRRLIIVGTGQPFPEDANLYVGTWQSNGFVFHVFE